MSEQFLNGTSAHIRLFRLFRLTLTLLTVMPAVRYSTLHGLLTYFTCVYIELKFPVLDYECHFANAHYFM